MDKDLKTPSENSASTAGQARQTVGSAPNAPIATVTSGSQPQALVPNGVPDYHALTLALMKKGIGFGKTGTLNYGGYFQEEYLNGLRGRNAIMTFDEMRRSDYQVGAVLAHLNNKIKSAKFFFEPPHTDNPASQERADYLNACLNEFLNKSWTDTITELLTVVPFGWALFEPTFKVLTPNDSSKYAGKWAIKSMGFRSQKTIWRWVIIDDKLSSVQQISYGDDAVTVDIPGEEVIVLTLSREGNNLEGISALRTAYGAWFRKQVYLTINGIGIERNALGIPHIEVPNNKIGTTEETMLDDAMQKYALGNLPYLKTPENWKFSFEKNDYDGQVTQEAIHMEDQNIAKALQAEFIELGLQGGGSGNRSLGKSKVENHVNGLKFIAQMICDALSTLGKRLEIVNFGEPEDGLFCKMQYTGIDIIAGEELANQLKILCDAKLLDADTSMKQYVRKIWEFPPQTEQDMAEAEQNKQNALLAAQAAADKAAGIVPIPGDKIPSDKASGGKDAASGEVVKEEKEHGATIKEIAADAKAGKEKPVEKYAKEIVDAHKAGECSHTRALKERRPLTEYEKRVNFAEVEKCLKDYKAEYTELLSKSLKDFVLAKYLKDLKSVLERSNDTNRYTNIHKIKLGYQGKIRQLLMDLVAKMVVAGRKQAKGEVTNKQELADAPGALPPGLFGWIRGKADFIAKTQLTNLDKVVSAAVTNSLDNEQEMRQTIFDAKEAGEEYVAAERNLGSGIMATSAVNEGRYSMFQEYKDEIQGFQFSALMENTCDLCESLDQQTFKIDDPAATEMTPPLHAQCQCILVPIMADEDEPDWTGLTASPEDIEKYKQLKERENG